MGINESMTKWNKSEPFELQVSRGQIRGHYSIFRSAYTTNCTTTKSTLWSRGTLYTFPSSASVMTVSSANALDVGIAVLVDGLDATYAPINEVVVLNGQTGVSTTKSYLRINGVTVLTAGILDGVFVGTGTITDGIPANIYGHVANGDHISQAAIYTVPLGHTLYVMAGSISSATTLSNKYLLADFHSKVNGVDYITAKISVSSSFQQIPYSPPLKVPEKTDLYTNVVSSQGTDQVAATLQGILIKNEGESL
jgi:hypothetical protein